MEPKFGLFVYMEMGMLGPGGEGTDMEHLDGFDEYSTSPKRLIQIANSMIQDFKDENFSGTFSFEIWEEDENGEYGSSGEAYWKKEITIK
jgi:hypothetical protein